MRVGLKSISSVILGLAILAGTATVPVFAAGSNDDTGNTKEPVSGRVNSSAAQLCSIVPNDGNCNNQDPIDQGCNGDAYTVTTADIIGLAKVELRYSPKCQPLLLTNDYSQEFDLFLRSMHLATL